MVVPLCVLLHICIAVHPPGGGNGPGNGLDQVGVNYGRVADNIPSPEQTVSLLTSMNVRLVKLFDANPAVLSALSNTSIRVTIMVPNEIIGNIATSQSAATDWIAQSVLLYPTARIIAIVVGNEIFSYPALSATWAQLMPAIQNLHRALRDNGLDDRIKITTSAAADVLATSYPPSAGAFRPDIRDTVIRPLLGFLRDTRAPFYINLYPYFAWASNPVNISLEYALFDPSATVVHDGRLSYNNLLDAMTDATFAAMEALGYGDVELGISETGWPNGGDPGDKGATRANAAAYNRRLVRKVVEARGTPMRPNTAIQTFIFALYNENLKPGPGTERHWGLLYPDGRPVYSIDMTGRLSDSQYDSVPEPMSVALVNSSSPSPGSSSSPSPGSSWCVARPEAESELLQRELDRVCSENSGDCAEIQDGAPCFYPNTIIAHTSYAFNRRWVRSGGECSFSSTAAVTSVNPSHGNCVFPSTSN